MVKNIVLICYKYPPEYSGYGKQLKSVLSTLDRIGHDFNLTLLTAFKSSINEEKHHLEIISFKQIERIKNESLRFYIFCIKTLFWLFKNREKYSIIHCIKAGPEAIISNLTSKVFKKKLIVKVAQDEMSSRELNKASPIKKIFRRVRHLLLKSTDNFIAISEEIENNLNKKVSKTTNIFKIPNGVDCENFYPINSDKKKHLRKKLYFREDSVIILYAGAINKRKGIIDLLEAIKHLTIQQNCTFVFCGPILEEINFLTILNSINQSMNNIDVIYRGKVNNIDQYMKASDIFILPSYSEGLPNVLLEAGATGLPLIATDIGGSRDIVKNGVNGYLVPINSPKELSKKISKLVNDQKLRERMGSESIKIIESNFSIEFIAQKYMELYNNI